MELILAMSLHPTQETCILVLTLENGSKQVLIALAVKEYFAEHTDTSCLLLSLYHYCKAGKIFLFPLY